MELIRCGDGGWKPEAASMGRLSSLRPPSGAEQLEQVGGQAH